VSTPAGAIPAMTADEAREITGRVRQSLALTWELIADLWERRGWEALGYGSWSDYWDAEYEGCALRVPAYDRQAAVAGLIGRGMSTRAAGAALGISEATVRRDAAASDDAPPAEVRGLDGKTYRRHLAAVPDPAEPPGTTPAEVIAVDAAQFTRAIRNVTPFASRDQPKAALCGIHLMTRGGALVIEATDSYAAGRETLPCDGAGVIDVLLSARDLDFAAATFGRLLADHGAEQVTVSAAADDGAVRLALGSAVLTAAVECDAGPFPSMDGILARPGGREVALSNALLARIAKVRSDEHNSATVLSVPDGDGPVVVRSGTTFTGAVSPLNPGSHE
jgi:hypothetical protein